MLYEIAKEQIRRNKELKESGGYVGIPVPFKRLSDYWPSLERGHSIMLLGATGSGKSKVGRFLSVYTPYKFYKKTGYKVRVFYFALEDNPIKVFMNMICHYLKEEFDIVISLQELQSKGDRHLPQFVMDKIDEAAEFFKDFEKIVTIIDGYTEPKEIYNVVKHYLTQPEIGEIIEEEVDIEGKKEKQYRYESDTHVVVLMDNYSNLDQGSDHDSERSTMGDMAKNIVRAKLCNFFKCTVFQIIQSDFATERMQYDSGGKAIMSKVEPTLSSSAESKGISRSAHVFLGLFAPHRYGFLTYPEYSKSKLEKDNSLAKKVYDIDILGNKFRALKILKNNDGDMGIPIGLYFDALTENVEELPPPDSPEMDRYYDQFIEKGKTGFVKVKQQMELPKMNFDLTGGSEDLPF